MIDISLSGDKELLADFERIANSPDGSKMNQQLLKIARELRKKIINKAPRGKYGKYGKYEVRKHKRETEAGVEIIDVPIFVKAGNLRRSIEARNYKRKIAGSPAVYVRVNSKKAPHYRLVEFGTNNFRYPKNGKVLRFDINGEEVFVKRVAPMPPQPFFRPTVDAEANNVENKIKKATEEVIEKASR